MRILMVTDNLPPRQYGGMAQHAWHVAQFLSQRHTVLVLTLRADREREALLGEAFSVKAVLTKRFPRWDFQVVRREARQFGADVAHVCTAGLADEGLSGICKVVTRVVGNDFLRPWCGGNLIGRSLYGRLPVRSWREAFRKREQRYRQKRIVEQIKSHQAVVANTEWTKQRLVEHGVPEAKVQVVTGGYDSSLFKPPADKEKVRRKLGWNRDEVVLLAACNVVRDKGIDTVLRALTKLAIAKLRYVILGDGPEETELKAMAANLGLSNMVEFQGRMGQKQLSRYFQGSDLYVQVSRVETMGRTYFEAGGCGIPVIAARVGGVPSVVADGHNGLLVEDPEDVEEVAAKMNRLLEDADLRRRLGAEGLRLAREKFSWERVGGVFERLLGE